MCIVFWTLQHSDYSLILCTNRDEHLSRPTQDAHFHNFGREGSQDVLSGIDILAGGTWMGINKATGRIAALTNILEPYHSFTSSRGTLVSSFLSSDASLPLEDDYHKLIPHDAKFTGFNLLVLSPTLPPSLPLKFDALMLSNDGAGGEITSHSLSPSAPCNVFSNAIEGGGDDWPKVRRGKAAFSSILESSTEREMSEEELVQRLFDMLAEQAPESVQQRAELRHTVQVAPFNVPDPTKSDEKDWMYATRLSTVVLIRKDGSVLFIERDIFQSVDGQVKRPDPPTQRVFRFSLDAVINSSQS